MENPEVNFHNVMYIATLLELSVVMHIWGDIVTRIIWGSI